MTSVRAPTLADPAGAVPGTRLHAGGVVPGGYSRVSAILALVPLLTHFGVNLDEVLRESGLPVAQFDDPENLIPFCEGSRLLGLCADHARCPHFGLLVGTHTSLEALGIVADIARSAPDVCGALLLINRFLTLSDGGGLGELSEGPQFAEWGYALYEPGVERTEVLYDHVLAFCWNIMRSLCGDRWRPHEVLFTRSTPTDQQPYRDFFKAPLSFDADRSALVFGREWLDTPLATGDLARMSALVAQVRDLEAKGTGNLLAQIRRVLRRQLLSGSVSIAKVADELGMHQRTLESRLQEDQASFRSLVDQVRFETSKQLLRTGLPIGTIAESLQYANPGAFTRAFQRWSGTTPLRWRASAVAEAT